MKYTAKINKRTGKLEWVDPDGKPCKPPRGMPKSDRPITHHKPTGWPLECEASGCHRSQVPAFEKMMFDAGVPTDFTPDGRAIYQSRSHRDKALRVRGIFDKDAGYSDPVPT